MGIHSIRLSGGKESREFQQFKASHKPIATQRTLISTAHEKAPKKENAISKLITKVGISIIEGAVVGALCAAFPAAAPQVLAAYKIYQLGKSVKEVEKAVKREKKDKFETGASAVAREGGKLIAGEVVSNITAGATDELGSAAADSLPGETSQLAREMMRSTVKYATQEGLSELATYTLEKGEAG